MSRHRAVGIYRKIRGSNFGKGRSVVSLVYLRFQLISISSICRLHLPILAPKLANRHLCSSQDTQLTMSSASQVQEQIYGLVKNEQYVQLAALCEDFELDVRNNRNHGYRI